MNDSYTELVSDYYMDLSGDEIYRIRERIENTPEDTGRKEWKALLKQIAREYTYSSRRYLVRFLKAADPEKTGLNRNSLNEEAGLDLNSISIEEIDQMLPEQVLACEELLREMIISNTGTFPEYAEVLVKKGMNSQSGIGRKKGAALLTREEAFTLGHLLHFTGKQMQEFLIRCFEDEGFRLKTSSDLIELYGFQNAYDPEQVSELKSAYEECASDIPKAEEEEYDSSYTKSLEDSLLMKIEQWKQSGRDEDDLFIEWLMEQAPYLDTCSRRTRCIYRNLTVFAYRLCRGEVSLQEMDFENIAGELEGYLAPEELPETAEILKEDTYDSTEKFQKGICRRIANTILEENYLASSSKRNYSTHEWSVLSAKENGEPTASGSESSKNGRVERILSGSTAPEKADILFMLWFVLNRFWSWTENDSAADIFCRIADLMDVSDRYLSEMMLPEFYPPHLLEQSLLLSIVSSSEEQSPSEVYEEICASVFARKNKTAGARRHSDEEKLQAVREFVDNPKKMKQICEKYQCSNKSIYGWQKTLEKKGLL